MADTIRDVVIRVNLEAGNMSLGNIDTTSIRSSISQIQSELSNLFSGLKLGSVDISSIKSAMSEISGITQAGIQVPSVQLQQPQTVIQSQSVAQPPFSAITPESQASVQQVNSNSTVQNSALDSISSMSVDVKQLKDNLEDVVASANLEAIGQAGVAGMHDFEESIEATRTKLKSLQRHPGHRMPGYGQSLRDRATVGAQQPNGIMKQRGMLDGSDDAALGKLQSQQEAKAALIVRANDSEAANYERMVQRKIDANRRLAASQTADSFQSRQFAIGRAVQGAGRFAAGVGSLYAFTGNEDLHKVGAALGMAHGLHSVYSGLSGMGGAAAGAMGLTGAAGAALSFGLPVVGTAVAGYTAYNMLAHQERQQLEFAHMNSGRDVATTHASVEFQKAMTVPRYTEHLAMGLTPSQAMTQAKNALGAERYQSAAFQEDVSAYIANEKGGHQKSDEQMAIESTRRHQKANFTIQQNELFAKESALREELSGLKKSEGEILSARDVSKEQRAKANTIIAGQKRQIETHPAGFSSAEIQNPLYEGTIGIGNRTLGGAASAAASILPKGWGHETMQGVAKNADARLAKSEQRMVERERNRPLSNTQQKEVMSLDVAQMNNQGDAIKEQASTAAALVANREKQLQIEMEIVKVLAEQGKNAREYAQEAQKAANHEKSAAREKSVASGARDIGDLWQEKRLQDKAKRIHAKQQQNLKEGKDKNEGVEQFTQHEKQVFNHSGNKWAFVSKEQSAQTDKAFGLEHEQNEETAAAAQKHADEFNGYADKKGAEAQEKGAKGQEGIEEAGKKLGEAVAQAIDFDKLTHGFEEQMVALRRRFEESIMKINSLTQ